MRIVHDNGQTDLDAGLLTLEDNHGKLTRYVRHDTEGTLPATPDLIVERGGSPELAPAHSLDGNSLGNTVLVGITPARDKGAAALTAAHEYKNNDHRFSIWMQFRKSGTSVAGRPD